MGTKRPRRTTLLEIDWQSWIVDMGHDVGAVDRAREVRSAARARGWPVVCSRYVSRHPEDGPRADPESPEASFVAGLGPDSGGTVVTKCSRDIFDVAETAAALARLRTEHLVLTGVMTDHGVALAARSAAARGLAVTVVADACAATSAQAHDRALADLRSAGAEIIRAAGLAAR
ncbi:isochorismatase family protein [Actinoplanes sp. NEAU-A12]|uniref:Isochorismatase family protein n=1 Tax=Actinoplanes sandaracinus TaxID=3045177 RepID=A0ABT6X0M5_9ACTN|nr:isochorismatase family protein [Actinoplanes sandaracinus]MDI6105534.1 isochorismatase family protein [Actinoplanes sandaracinus]